MTPPHAFHLAAKLDIAPDPGIVQDAEAVYNGTWSAHGPNYLLGIQIQVLLVPNGQNHGLHHADETNAQHNNDFPAVGSGPFG